VEFIFPNHEKKEIDKELLYSERGFFVKSVNGFENSDGNFCNSFTVSLYNIPKDSLLEIRFVTKIDFMSTFLWKYFVVFNTFHLVGRIGLLII
jgi:hypothetical protein